MPRYRITGDILTAFAETLDLPKGFDIEDESVREQIALAVGIRRYGREQDFNVCDVIEVDAEGNEIVEADPDAEATVAPAAPDDQMNDSACSDERYRLDLRSTYNERT